MRDLHGFSIAMFDYQRVVLQLRGIVQYRAMLYVGDWHKHVTGIGMSVPRSTFFLVGYSSVLPAHQFSYSYQGIWRLELVLGRPSRYLHVLRWTLTSEYGSLSAMPIHAWTCAAPTWHI